MGAKCFDTCFSVIFARFWQGFGLEKQVGTILFQSTVNPIALSFLKMVEHTR